jgi:hypothetical protein
MKTAIPTLNSDAMTAIPTINGGQQQSAEDEVASQVEL